MCFFYYLSIHTIKKKYLCTGILKIDIKMSIFFFFRFIRRLKKRKMKSSIWLQKRLCKNLMKMHQCVLLFFTLMGSLRPIWELIMRWLPSLACHAKSCLKLETEIMGRVVHVSVYNQPFFYITILTSCLSIQYLFICSGIFHLLKDLYWMKSFQKIL